MSQSAKSWITEEKLVAFAIFKEVMQGMHAPNGKVKAYGMTIDVDQKAKETLVDLPNEEVREMLLKIKARLESYNG